jgi:hypothetical protein
MSKKFYSDKKDLAQYVVNPIIEEFKKEVAIENLKKLFGQNLEKVCAASFQETMDKENLVKFMLNLKEKLDINNQEQIKLYNSLHDIVEESLNSPKQACEMWVNYEMAAENCKYMHLLASFCENVDPQLFLIGNTDI